MWDLEALDDRTLCRLQANQDQLYKKNTNGEQVNAIIEMLQKMSDSERQSYLKPEAFRRFAKDTFGIQANNTPRILAVLRHPTFMTHVRFFTSTRYGQAVFSFGLMEAIISSKLDEVSFHSVPPIENDC